MKAKLFCLLLSVGISVASLSQANAATFCGGSGYNATVNLSASFQFSWSICGSGMDAQIVAQTTNWVGLAWGPSNLDGLQANVVSGTTTVHDVFSTSGFLTTPTIDTVQNLSDISGSESSGVTTITFSRLLITGDTNQDFDLAALLTRLYFFIGPSDNFSQVFNLTQSGFTDVNLAAGIATPLPAALPLFVTGLGAFGLLGWHRKRKVQAAT